MGPDQATPVTPRSSRSTPASHVGFRDADTGVEHRGIASFTAARALRAAATAIRWAGTPPPTGLRTSTNAAPGAGRDVLIEVVDAILDTLTC